MRLGTRSVLALCLLAAGCVSPLESMMLTEDTALISSLGNTPNDKGKVIEASLQEAARLTTAKGYQYFVILDAADASRAGRRPRDRTRRPGETNIAMPFAMGQLALTRVYRDYFQQNSGSGETFLRPGIDITIRMYREGEIDPKGQGVWNSAELIKNPSSALPIEP